MHTAASGLQGLDVRVCRAPWSRCVRPPWQDPVSALEAGSSASVLVTD